MNMSIAVALMLPVVALLLASSSEQAHAESQPLTDWSDWHKYRHTVKHPCTVIKPDDLDRMRRNVKRHEWARKYAEGMRKYGERLAAQVTPEYLDAMVEITTPATTGPCPACRAKGLPWHPNGQWSWSHRRPNELTCRVCKTVFPNDEFPESVVLQSQWDPRQKLTFVGGDTFKCFGYRYARPSHTGIIRGRKFQFVTSQLHNLAVAYAVAQNPACARAVKAILLRFAEVFPKYLVYAGYGYGEYADCDPHVAAERIMDLPNDELVYPPNEPDRKIWTGYWSASRVGSSGMDGGWVSRVTLAYDLTCEATDKDGPVYADDERVRIEREVLLEGAYLALCDRSINNKSVGNRAGAAMVGLCVGHPGLVRFGIEGFRRTVDDWFLPDGGTSESAAYALMTMGGVRNFPLAFRDYSEPEDYVGPDGQRLDHLNAARDTLYGDCWQGLVWTLQGDLRFPALADSYRTTAISPTFVELLGRCYPTPEHLALLRELSGDVPRARFDGIFYREPDLQTEGAPPLTLPDVVFPYLSQGYLRRGEDGRRGLAVLNASDWGGHHHLDSLDLYYWQEGRELLSDLGYLWDHPDKKMTTRTLAHNLVVVDGQDQRTRGRGGSLRLFSVTPQVKVMEASSSAYPQAREYRRTCIQVDHGDAGSYLVDIFRVAGGTVRDYVFHGPGNDYAVEGLALEAAIEEATPVKFAVRFQLPQLSEIAVAGVTLCEIRDDGTEGPNLVADPTPPGAGGLPKGWGRYIGDGSAEWGMATARGGNEAAVRFRAAAPHANGRVNVALVAGDSDGYRGPHALPGRLGAKYRLRFSIRGSAKRVNVGFVMWPKDPKSPRDRVHGGLLRIAAGDDWTTHGAVFSLPRRSAKVANQRASDGSKPWRIVWDVDDEYRFSAWSPGAPGETVLIGDGWGQRDHRNTDRGATLPYIFRRREKANGADAFVSVFAGEMKSKPLVRGVQRISTAGGVALAVGTALGVDLVVSQTASADLTVRAAAGEMLTDARAAVLMTEESSPVYACFVSGTKLVAPSVELAVETPSYSGTIASAESDPGGSYFVVSGDLPDSRALVGSTVFVVGEDGIRRAYPIRDVRRSENGTRLYTKASHVGFEAEPAETWEIPVTVAWRRR